MKPTPPSGTTPGSVVRPTPKPKPEVAPKPENTSSAPTTPTAAQSSATKSSVIEKKAALEHVFMNSPDRGVSKASNDAPAPVRVLPVKTGPVVLSPKVDDKKDEKKEKEAPKAVKKDEKEDKKEKKDDKKKDVKFKEEEPPSQQSAAPRLNRATTAIDARPGSVFAMDKDLLNQRRSTLVNIDTKNAAPRRKPTVTQRPPTIAKKPAASNSTPAEPAAVVEPAKPVDTPEAKAERMRQNVVNELIHTERVYVADLEVICRVFTDGFKKSTILTKEETTCLFSNVEMLLLVNTYVRLLMTMTIVNY